jgi:hypothetical protein
MRQHKPRDDATISAVTQTSGPKQCHKLSLRVQGTLGKKIRAGNARRLLLRIFSREVLDVLSELVSDKIVRIMEAMAAQDDVMQC